MGGFSTRNILQINLRCIPEKVLSWNINPWTHQEITRIHSRSCVYFGSCIGRPDPALRRMRTSARILTAISSGDSAPIPKPIGTQPEDLMIKDLNSQTRRFNIDVSVAEKSMPRIVFSRWGGEFLLSTATVTDQSGTIKLPLWNQQTSNVSIGDRLHIENARVKRFRGELQIRVGKSSTLQIVEK